MPKRKPAVVKMPMPERLILTATGFAPKSMQRNTAKNEAPIGSSLALACCVLTDDCKTLT